MRLTLRTLLAYLDDVLEPSQTKEIGQKIQESPVAEALVSRIRDVVRRRRLGAPEPSDLSSETDPNLIAEYLDNCLPADQVADIERICLESDLHLAEVAACHQILTLVLGEPVSLPQTSLNRLYALGPVAVPLTMQAEHDAATSRVAESTPLVAAPVSADPLRFEKEMPESLRSAPWSQRYGSVLGITAVVVAALMALSLDSGLRSSVLGLVNRPADTSIASPNATVTEAVSSANGRDLEQTHLAGDAPLTVPVAGLTPTEIPAAPGTSVAALPADIDPAPPADAPEPGEKMVTAAADRPATPSSPQPSIASQPSVGPLPAAPVPSSGVAAEGTAAVRTMTPVPAVSGTQVAAAVVPAKPPSPAVAEVSILPRVEVTGQYSSTEGVLLRFEPADMHWHLQPRRSEVHVDELIACPDPFEAVLLVDQGQWQVTLLADTVVRLLAGTPEQPTRLELLHGRILVSHAVAKANRPSELVLVTGQEATVLAMAEGAGCAVERQFVRPTGLPFPPVPQRSVCRLWTVTGKVDLRRGNVDMPAPNAGQPWLLSPEGSAGGEPTSAPAWIDPTQRVLTTMTKRFAILFEKEFDPQIAIDLSIPTVAKDDRPRIAELAARCLATTERYTDLIALLATSPHVEVRSAAAAGLRSWMIQDDARVAILKQELANRYSNEDWLPVSRLLLGFNQADARDRLTSVMLVEWLRSPYIEVRELAIDQIETLAGKRHDFKPSASAPVREAGIIRWMNHIDREGALLRPE